MHDSVSAGPSQAGPIIETDQAVRHSFWRRTVVPIVFVTLLVAWTGALLAPVPPAAITVLGGPARSFWFAKALHVSVYATLAILAVLLPLSRNGRLIALAILIAHGGATEYLQQFFGRGSSVRDFGLDFGGLILGVGLAVAGRRVYSRQFCRESSQTNLQDNSRGEYPDTADLR